MEIYKNKKCQKVRGSHILEVSCAYCKCFIARYQKVGHSNFMKMYNERIIEGTVDFAEYHGAIFCPACGERIATRYGEAKKALPDDATPSNYAKDETKESSS